MENSHIVTSAFSALSGVHAIKNFARVGAFCFVSAATLGIAGSASAQEACISDAQNGITNWAAANGSTLETLWDRYEASSNPNAEIAVYNGKTVPLTYALETEQARFQKAGAAVRNQKIKEATECASAIEVVIPRAAWDLTREPLTWVLPERATRIDFEEIRRGNILGGPDSLVNKGVRDVRDFGRAIDKALNPFW